MKNFNITVTINGNKEKFTVKANDTLLDVLRENGHTEVKHGCETGECGTCTVLMDQKSVRTCIMLAYKADGKTITTIRGLEQDGRLHPLQESFMENAAIQCGFCTPGMVLTAKELLDKNPVPTREEIRSALAGQLCRCVGYVKQIKAVEAAAKKMKK
jgi:carbon-monoxide dehydrogenase small subunit